MENWNYKEIVAPTQKKIDGILRMNNEKGRLKECNTHMAHQMQEEQRKEVGKITDKFE